MKFEKKYTGDDFLAVLSTASPKSISAIMAAVGCGKSTAKRYLRDLETDGKIKRITIEGSIHYGYIKK